MSLFLKDKEIFFPILPSPDFVQGDVTITSPIFGGHYYEIEIGTTLSLSLSLFPFLFLSLSV